MPSKTNVEDIESGAEFERIKQNFRSTVVAADVTINVAEYHTALQDLQMELQSFLAEHLSRVKDLQSLISSDHNRVVHKSNATVPDKLDEESLSLHPPDDDPPTKLNRRDTIDTISHRTVSNQGPKASHHAPHKVDKAPLDAHAQAILSFLQTHASNIRSLQASLQDPSMAETKPSVNTVVFPYKAPVSTQDTSVDPKRFDAFNQQFTMLVVISTFTAALIIGFLSLVLGIVGTKKRTAYSVGMFFAFIALLIHLGTIIVAGRGASITSQQEKQYDSLYFKLLLVICEQLQFIALGFFGVSFVIMSFLIFSSVAFPIVLIFFAIFASLAVFSSAYWEVSITLRNVRYLAKNFQRFKQSLEYLRIRAREDKDISGKR